MLLRVTGVVLLSVLTSCGGADGPTRPNPPGGNTPTITSIDPLTPGQTAALRGTNLSGISALTVDGRPAVLSSSSGTEVRFTVPALRTCETDGRAVEVVANGTLRSLGTVMTPDLVRLQPGESRILSVAELNCIQLSGEVGSYVLSAHNFSRERVSERFFRLRSYTVAADTATTVFPSFNFAPAPPERDFLPIPRNGGEAQVRHAAAATPFDERYAKAEVGDTLVFVDWSKLEAVTARSRDQVPVYRALVLAVAGQQVVVLDLRTTGAATLVASSEVRDRLRRAAEIVDAYSLRALRAVIDPRIEYPVGAGGRVFTIVGELPTGIAGGISTADLLDTAYSPWVSKIGVVNISAALAREQNLRAEQLATTIIHEQGHLADVLAGQSRGVASAQGWFTEAIAVAVEERAARMALGQEHGASPAQTQATGVPAFALRVPDALSQVYSPWGPLGSGAGASSTGAYVRGLRLVLYAMEQLGETGLAPAERSLYQRLLAHSPATGSASADEIAAAWGIDAIAREVGLSAEALMARATIAELTDDLVAVDAVAQHALPQYRTWNDPLPSRAALQQRISPAHWLPLDAARAGEIHLPGGAHHYWYLVTEPGRGLSVAATQIRLESHHQVRVTRLW